MTAGARRRVRSVARTMLAAIGVLLLVNALWLAVTANLTLGTGLVALTGVGLTAWAVVYQRLGRWPWLPVLAGLVAVAVLATSGFLYSVGSGDNVTYREDAVIVLGAAVHGSQLSNTLKARLDKALEYRRQNPRALIAVTGGQGFQENLPEGVAMRDYLVAQGVPVAAVVVEDQATSTEENFALTKARLDAKLPPGYTVAFVTDQFHVYRSGRIAAGVGYRATHLGSVTPWYFTPTNYLREVVLVLRSWLPG